MNDLNSQVISVQPIRVQYFLNYSGSFVLTISMVNSAHLISDFRNCIIRVH